MTTFANKINIDYLRKEGLIYVSFEWLTTNNIKKMFGHIAEFTAWPILTGLIIGYVANCIMNSKGKVVF